MRHRRIGDERPRRRDRRLVGGDHRARDRHALRRAGAAGGEEHGRPIRGRVIDVKGRARRARRLGDQRRERVGVEDRLRPRGGEIGACGLGRRAGAKRIGRQRHMHEAAAQAGELQRQRVDAGGRERADPVAGTKAISLRQQRGELTRQPRRFAVAQRAPALRRRLAQQHAVGRLIRPEIQALQNIGRLGRRRQRERNTRRCAEPCVSSSAIAGAGIPPASTSLLRIAQR